MTEKDQQIGGKPGKSDLDIRYMSGSVVIAEQQLVTYRPLLQTIT